VFRRRNVRGQKTKEVENTSFKLW
jgi:exonuclease III